MRLWMPLFIGLLNTLEFRNLSSSCTVIQIRKKTYLVLRGSLLAFFYDDAGNVTDKVCLNPSEGKYRLEIPY